MKYSLLLVFLTVWVSKSFAQNLILNGGFELYSDCPEYSSEIIKANGWIAGGQGGTPDFYHVCANKTSSMDVPNGVLGYQRPHGGKGFAGIFINRIGTTVREYLGTSLKFNLEKNSRYRFQMFINLTDQSKYSSSSIGVYFADEVLTGFPGIDELPFKPQIENPKNNIPDTVSWIEVSGEFTATGGENFILIGNFNTDEETDTFFVGGEQELIYVLVDDISLIKLTIDSLTTTPYIESEIFSNEITIHNNGNQPATIEIFLESGEELFSHNIVNMKTLLDLSSLPKGIYFYRILISNQIVKQGEITKV